MHQGDGDGVIVVAGEALIDLVPAADGRVAAHAGGGPFNAARAAARLGAPAAYLGRLSSDPFGVRLRAALQDDGVDLSPAVATDDPTTLALADVGPDGSARYGFYVAGTSAPGLTPEAARAALPARVAALCVGTLGLVFDPTASTLEGLVAAADDATLVLLDPNCRPAAVPDADAYRARLGRILRRTDVVKASDDDLAWLRPGLAPADAMRALLVDAPGAVGLVTVGGDGALVVTRDDVRAVPAPRVEVADTIGAGDAFAGGFVAWWHEQGLGRADLARTDRLTEAAAFACRVAARTCARPGADPPRRDEV
ncbi:PfkB family carbohydrate kinase [Patulibacter sp. SYSU D01012]|uniref:PfkB family carbohydrate kinase n=1 Tax=Patulibacter sp. SYSU D01012 TaxID=2817381 RepID=UPI001B312E07